MELEKKISSDWQTLSHSFHPGKIFQKNNEPSPKQNRHWLLDALQAGSLFLTDRLTEKAADVVHGLVEKSIQTFRSHRKEDKD
jgi:hypothetical protein